MWGYFLLKLDELEEFYLDCLETLRLESKPPPTEKNPNK
jgi:hypothetical protein